MAEKLNEQEQAERNKQLAELEQVKKDYVDTFSSKAGKRVLEHLESICFIKKTTYSPELNRTFFSEGQRFIVVHIKNMMDMDIGKLRKLAA